MKDCEIVELYWCKDEAAIIESERHYGAYCRKIANNILGSLEDSDECVNDTWHRTWNSIPPQKPISLSAFFGRIVRNLSIDRYRKNRAIKRYNGVTVLLSELDDCIPENASVFEKIERKHLSGTINRWLSTLSKDDRVFFVRRYWYGDVLKDLANECGLTENQMAQKMLRLRKHLRNTLEQEGIAI